MRRIIAILLLTAAPTYAQIDIMNAVACGDWLASREAGRSSAPEVYVVGILNGLSLGRGEEFWVREGHEVAPEQVFLWMDAYCRDRPLGRFIDGVSFLFMEGVGLIAPGEWRR